MEFHRLLKMDLPKRQSAFLWGARKTGKSTYLKQNFPDAIYYDLLQMDTFSRFLKQPHLLREELLANIDQVTKHPVIIDEIQKIPDLLNEVHHLIEAKKIQFVLCGSSARKLKRLGTNMLGGRAWRYTFYPLVFPEIPNFNLLKALNHGLIPDHYQDIHYRKSIKAYLFNYLKEEIQAEALVRNLAAFSRFLDVQAYGHGQLTNFNNISRDCGVDSKTVKEYFQILVDTLLGYFIYPFHGKKSRDEIISMPKFYLFDVGVSQALTKLRIAELRGAVAGAAFEHYILMELIAYRGLNDLDFPIYFWRSKSGLEVDFVLGEGEIAIEVKISTTVHKSEISGLLAFQETYQPKKALVISQDVRPRQLSVKDKDILILPWKEFLTQLWKGKII